MARTRRTRKPRKIPIEEIHERLHPSLKGKLIPLPEVTSSLSMEEVRHIFSGDLNALRDLGRLIHQQEQDEIEENR